MKNINRLAVLTLIACGSAVAGEAVNYSKHIDQSITGLKIESLDTFTAARIATHQQQAVGGKQKSARIKLVTLELLIDEGPVNRVHTKHIRLFELTAGQPYSIKPNSIIEAVLENRQGQTQPLGLKMELMLNGLTPDHDEDPYRVSCFVPVIKMKWGKVECQPSPKKPAAGEPLSLPDANAGTK